jgi:hypothetical protein
MERDAHGAVLDSSQPPADVAQLAEQLFCKQQVRSSSLLVGSQKLAD